MIVRHFLDWIRTAPAGKRAEATGALARAYLYSDLAPDDAVATGNGAVQSAIATRAGLPRAVAAAIAEVGTAEACLVLAENAEAEIAAFSVDRMLERFGHLAAIREALLAREDIAPATRLTLVAKVSETLVDFVSACQWLDVDHAQRIAREACEKATVA